jgi:hypothetical protein
MGPARLSRGKERRLAMRNWFPVLIAVLWVAMTALALSEMALFSGATAPRHRPPAAATSARRPPLQTELGAL